MGGLVRRCWSTFALDRYMYSVVRKRIKLLADIAELVTEITLDITVIISPSLCPDSQDILCRVQENVQSGLYQVRGYNDPRMG